MELIFITVGSATPCQFKRWSVQYEPGIYSEFTSYKYPVNIWTDMSAELSQGRHFLKRKRALRVLLFRRCCRKRSVLTASSDIWILWASHFCGELCELQKWWRVISIWSAEAAEGVRLRLGDTSPSENKLPVGRPKVGETCFPNLYRAKHWECSLCRWPLRLIGSNSQVAISSPLGV